MAARKAVWLVPDLIEGSGGHRTILDHARYMSECGWQIVIYLESVTQQKSETAAELVKRLFGYEFEQVHIGWDQIEKADAYFATIWYSAQVVNALPEPAAKYYFVQDYEAYFYPVNDTFLMAENSYRYGLNIISIGNWLSHRMRLIHQVEARPFLFSADINTYKPLALPREDAVCFVFQPEKPRRCAEIGLRALEIVKHFRPQTKIYLYGSNSKKSIPFECEHLGLISISQCNELYNKSAVGLCISATNPSRVPFEMMAAGLPVVDIWQENNLFDFPDSAMELCAPEPESIAKGIISLLDDEQRRKDMSESGIAYMQNHHTDDAMQGFISAVDAYIAGESEFPVIERLYCKEPLRDVEKDYAFEGQSFFMPGGFVKLLKSKLPPVLYRLLHGFAFAVKDRLS